MSFATIYEASQDSDLRNRVAAAYTSITSNRDGGWWADQHMLAIAAGQEIADAWAYSADTNPHHGRRGLDPGIITDEMITNAVSAVLGHEQEE